MTIYILYSLVKVGDRLRFRANEVVQTIRGVRVDEAVSDPFAGLYTEKISVMRIFIPEILPLLFRYGCHHIKGLLDTFITNVCS